MAAVTSAGSPAWVRRIVMTLMHGMVRDRGVAATTLPKRRRHYPPKRDLVIEEAAMAREMYRL